MVVYSIKDIEEITGVKAHTLRIWEKRYDIIKPERTKTNIRFYTEDHLKYILSISLLNKNGFKISQIAGMSDVQIKDHTSRLSNTEKHLEDQLDVLTFGVINMDDFVVNRILDKYIDDYGFEKTMDLLINPFLEKLSTLWVTGTVKSVHESFISEILRQRTAVEIKKLKAVDPTLPKIMIYLSDVEKQELSMVFLQYILRSKGLNVTIAGFDLSIKDVLDAYQILAPKFIYTIINQSLVDHNINTYINYLAKAFGESKFILSGMQMRTVSDELPSNCMNLNDLDSVIDYFTAVSKLDI